MKGGSLRLRPVRSIALPQQLYRPDPFLGDVAVHPVPPGTRALWPGFMKVRRQRVLSQLSAVLPRDVAGLVGRTGRRERGCQKQRLAVLASDKPLLRHWSMS